MMDDKIVRFFNKIKLKEEFYSSFCNATLEKVIVNKKNNSWDIFINLDKLIDISVFKELIKSTIYFKEVSKINFVFSFRDDNKLLKDYFYFYFSNFCKKCPLLKTVLDNEINFDKNIVNVEIINLVEKNKIEGIEKELLNKLKIIGFNDIKINKILNNKKREEFKEQIKKQETIIKSIVKEDNQVIGLPIRGKITEIKDVVGEESNVIFEAYIFDFAIRETKKNNYNIFTFKVSDKTDSLIAKVFTNDLEIIKNLKKGIKINSWYRMKGYIKHDDYMHELVLNIRDIEKIKSKNPIVIDDAEEKRVELHLHTKMSQMDGLIDYEKGLFNKLKELGHKKIGVTDKNTAQEFPKLFKNKGDVKVLYGSEIYVVDDDLGVIKRGTNDIINDTTFVVFDLETTGLSAGSGDSIIEIGAVKIKNGEIIEKYNELINPGVKLKQVITDITNITDEMLEDKDNEENAIKRFVEWFKDLPMVAHNAKFDTSFIEMCYKKYNLGEFKNPIIDTMSLDKVLNPDITRHSLSACVKRYNVEFEEGGHHRADYDALGTGKLLAKMFDSMDSKIKTINDLNELVDKEQIHKLGRPYHITVYAINEIGMKNLFKIITLCNTKYLYKTPRILKSELIKLREGTIIGSGCVNGEIFNSAKTNTEEELTSNMLFYDFIEVNPPSICEYLVDTGDFSNIYELKETIRKIIRCAKSINKLVCATGDVHTLNKEDNIYRDILINQKVSGGGFHQLYRKNINKIPNAYFMTTKEMLEEFNFLDKKLAYEIVVKNTNIVADMTEDLQILKPGLNSPRIENSVEITKNMVYENAKSIYGENLPQIIIDRIDKELNGIINSQFDVIYLIAQKLVKKSNDDGYIVGSRGSVGSSLVATFMDITEVNPLPAHYICPKCKKSIFEIDGEPLSKNYGSGFDLPDKICDCGEKMIKQGQEIPFETFLGFNADKVPDIDLNFSGEYQAQAHEYTKVLFGEDKVYRAGTVTTIAEKTAFGFVKGYCETKEITKRNVEIERLAKGITGIKRTSGQHPGGIVVVPDYKDIFDFTPFQFPAENTSAAWYTTHFEYHDIEENLLKLDILGHDDPTVLKHLGDTVGINIKDIPLDDKEVMSLFSSPNALGVTKEDINCPTGTLGVPEFGTNFVINMLVETKPKTFAELIKISGLSHGTDVWNGNARDLILNKICEFKEVVGCRDDIMVYLISKGIEKGKAFKISEFIRKGKSVKEPDKWVKHKETMKNADIPDWYINSCEKIKYMFPKAHAAAYVTMAYRVAWFKVYKPLDYYRVYLSIRESDFDILAMISGKEKIKEKIIEIANKGFGATNKEISTMGSLKICLEMICRGYTFENISLEKSDSLMFKKDEKNKALIPPFIVLDGMGDTVAKKIVEERKIKKFVSIEDFQIRGKVSQTIIDKLRGLGSFNDLPESSQLSLF